MDLSGRRHVTSSEVTYMVSQPGGNQLGKAKSSEYPYLVATWSDLTTVVDSDGYFLYCSAALQSAFGWGQDELVGRREDDFAHPDDASALLRRRSKRSRSELVTTGYRFRCRDGSYR
jgi:PAS domain S-box-containing protein